MSGPLPPLHLFRHPLVRDLCWTLDPACDLLEELPPYRRFSPPQELDALGGWVRDIDQDPRILDTFMSNPAYRKLGRHFEQLVLFYLSHAPASPFQVLGHNQPIRSKNPAGLTTTVGELDFLLARSGARLHLETAVKFYLGIEQAGKAHWIGPGLKDQLDRKLRHLHNHQLPLSQTLHAEPMERYFWLKGVLFHPWPQVLRLPEGIMTPDKVSFWLTCSQVVEALPTFAGDWFCLPKLNWLGGIRTGEIATAERIRQHFEGSSQVLMLWNEAQATRSLIVADQWPATARTALCSV